MARGRGRSYGGRCASTGSSGSKSGGRRRRPSRKSLPGYTLSPRPLGQGPNGFPKDSVDLARRKREKAGIANYRSARYGNRDGEVDPIAELYRVRLSPKNPAPGSAPRKSKVSWSPQSSGSKGGSSSSRGSPIDYASPLPDKVDFDDDVFADDDEDYVGQNCSFMKFHPDLLKNVYRYPRRSSEDYLECEQPRTREMDESDIVPAADFGGFDNPNFSPVIPQRGSGYRTPNRPVPRRQVRSAPPESMKVAEDVISPWRFRDAAPRQRYGSRYDLSMSPFDYNPRFTSTPLAPQKPIPRTFLGKNVPDDERYRQPFQPFVSPKEPRPRDFVIFEDEEPLENEQTSDEDDPWADFVPAADKDTPGENGARLRKVDDVDRSHRRMSLLQSPSPEKRVRRKSYLLSNGVDVSTANTSDADTEDLNSLDDPSTDNEQ